MQPLVALFIVLLGLPFIPANRVPQAPPASATVTRENDHWVVKLADGVALPLQFQGDKAPPLLDLVDFAVQAVPTAGSADAKATAPMLPKVLVYQAGTTSGGDLTTGTITVERAVFWGADGKPIGDALWAVRTEPGAKPVPQPVWTFTADKLTIENPLTKTVQEISLLPKKK